MACDIWRKKGFGEDLIAKNFFMQDLGLDISSYRKKVIKRLKTRRYSKQKGDLRQNMDITFTFLFSLVQSLHLFIYSVNSHIFLYSFSMPDPLGSVKDSDTLVDKRDEFEIIRAKAWRKHPELESQISEGSLLLKGAGVPKRSQRGQSWE